MVSWGLQRLGACHYLTEPKVEAATTFPRRQRFDPYRAPARGVRGCLMRHAEARKVLWEHPVITAILGAMPLMHCERGGIPVGPSHGEDARNVAVLGNAYVPEPLLHMFASTGVGARGFEGPCSSSTKGGESRDGRR